MNYHPIGLTAAERGRRAGRIAEAIAACIAARHAHFGCCDRAALIRDGFTPGEILRHGAEARRLIGDRRAA